MKGIIIHLYRSLRERLRSSQGNILVYIVLTMVIFGVLGVTMVSLFSTSISSSATQNDTRRATYLSEAGTRYAMSEMRANDFSRATISNLQTTLYTLDSAGQFDLNIFSPWYEAASSYDTGAQQITVDVPEGELPEGYLANLPAGDADFLLVNHNAFDPLHSDAQSPITGFIPNSPASFQIQLADDLVVHANKQVALAVTPFSGGQTIPFTQDFLDLKPVARNIFPQFGGAFTVQGKDFYYTRVDPTVTDRVRLLDVRRLIVPGESPAGVTVAEDDPVMLTPLRNRLIVSEGRSGLVTFGNRIDYAAAIVDHSFLPAAREADISIDEPGLRLSDAFREVEQVTNPAFIGIDDTERMLTIGGGAGPSLGAVWFRDTRSIGGIREFCNSNGCFFKDGIRVFFLLDYTGSSDGFIFSLINGAGTDAVGNLKNDTASVGGDIERSEMLGYSGDSRLDVAGTQFLDNSGLYRGLIPPKIGVEFDTKVNISSGDNYCSNSTNLRANTRNDPGTPAAQNRDAVQFVYWGNSSIDVPCRLEPFCQLNPSCTGDPSYDDNRHNATFPNWKFYTGGAILSAPAIAADGTVYVGSNSTRFYAVNPDGTEKWPVNLAGPWYSPTLTSSGRIYVGTGATENRLFAIRDEGTYGNILWSYPTGGPVTTKPAVGTIGTSNGIIYFGSDDGTFRAVNSSGALIWPFTPFGPPQPLRSSPAISTSGNTVYFGSNNGNLYARRANDGGFVWTVSVGAPFLSSPVVGPDGTVYVGNDDGRLYAFNGASGTELWRFDTGAPVRSSPALNNDGTRVYIGSESNNRFAVNSATGVEIWRFTGASGDVDSPIRVDSNDHIYFGSDDDNVYALYPDGTLKWSLTTGGNVEVKPAVKSDGTVYVGSSDGYLYSINQVTTPANLKDLLITSTGTSVGGVPVNIPFGEADWLNTTSAPGPWAVRLEITRSQVASGGTYAYNLKAWVRQCNSNLCSDPLDPLGTFYEDTRVQYSTAARPPMIEQTVNLEPADHAAFERFIFGFTSQTGAGETQTATIRKFQLSFIRTNDPVVTADPQWP